MIDQGDLPKLTESTLTPEQISKSDKDLTTFDSLETYAREHDSLLQVHGGYGVEAYLGGKITRPHGDMDAILWLGDPTPEQTAIQEVNLILNNEGTNWTKLETEKEHFADFRGEEPDKEFLARRRLELYLFDRSRVRKLQTKTIKDSHGNVHEVLVVPIEDMVADKIAIIQRNLDLSKEELAKRKLRETNDNDRSDLRKLINHPDFSKDKYIPAMIGYLIYGSGGKMSEEAARERAETMWINAIREIGYSQQGSLKPQL